MPWRLGYLILEEVWLKVAGKGLVKFCVGLQLSPTCAKLLASGFGDESKSRVGLSKQWSEKRGKYWKYRTEGSVSNWELPSKAGKESSLFSPQDGMLWKLRFCTEGS